MPDLVRTWTICFFPSGATALVYEVVWLRMLGLVFGHTVCAITAVPLDFDRSPEVFLATSGQSVVPEFVQPAQFGASVLLLLPTNSRRRMAFAARPTHADPSE